MTLKPFIIKKKFKKKILSDMKSDGVVHPKLLLAPNVRCEYVFLIHFMMLQIPTKKAVLIFPELFHFVILGL